MGFLVKEYNIPQIGKVKLIKSSPRGYEESFNGKYYSKIGDSSGELVTKCNSLEELIEKTINKIELFYKEQQDILCKQINEKEQKIITLNGLTEKINNLEDKALWLTEYQTDNPLQLEFQIKHKQQ